MQTTVLVSSSSQQTHDLAKKIGRQLRGSEVIRLIGDLGAGKTAFVKGLAEGIASKDRVSSPTFTVSNVYQGDPLTIHHYDFYRITDLAIMQQELAEVLEDKQNVVVVEWGDGVTDVLPTEHLIIRFKVTSGEGRELNISLPESYNYIKDIS